MAMNLAKKTKADVYAVAQDLAERLERQKALNEALRAELTELAARPCLACAVAPTHAALITEARQLLDGAIRQEGLARINNHRREILSQVKELEKLEIYRTALKRISNHDKIILGEHMDQVRAIAREALEL